MAIRRRLLFGCLWLCAGIIVPGNTARAEVRVRDLTSPAVEGVGPFYQDVNDAIAAFTRRDFQTALARLQNAKKLTPALPPPEVMMAKLYFDAGDTRGGVAMLEAAAKSAPNDPEAFVTLAERALAEGRVTEAELMYRVIEKPIEDFNQNPRRRQDLRLRAYSLGASVDQQRGRLDAAKKKLEALVRLDASNARAHEQLGRMLLAQKDREGAYKEFQLAAQLDTEALPAELMMATLYSDKVGAEKWLNYAIKQNPNDLRTQLGAANYLLQTNRIAKAKAHAAKAVELDPDGYDTNMVAGLIARMEGDFAKAAKHLSAAHLLQPVNFVVMNHLALVLLELPDDASHLRALQFAQLVARENPNDPNYLATLGWINYRLNRRADADRFFSAALNSSQVLATQTMSSEMGFYLANLAKDRGRPQEAVRLLQDALNTEQPFAYRKAASELLAQLAKSSGTSGATQTGQQAN